MPPTTHTMRGSNVTFELTPNLIGIIQHGLEAHSLVDTNEQ